MSITYCHNCNHNIDTDFDSEHFDVCGKEEDDNSMIKLNPFWEEIKVEKGTKMPNTEWVIDKAYAPTDKYLEVIEKLLSVDTAS